VITIGITASGFSKGIVFPEQQNLVLKTKFSGDTFRPSQDTNVKFSVLDGSGHSAESALGVVVFDKAVEQRAQTDEEFGSYFGRFASLLGLDRAYGRITLKDLNDLDLSKDISPDTELAAEIMLAGSYYRPRVYHDDGYNSRAATVYGDFFERQLTPLGDVIKKEVASGAPFPIDMQSLVSMFARNNSDLQILKDPWGRNYDVTFTIERTRGIISFVSAGPDKKPGTDDDIVAFTTAGSYFAPLGRAIDDAILKYTADTGRFIRDRETLLAQFAKVGIDIKKLKDPWGHEYQVTVDVAGRNYRTVIWSYGPDGKKRSSSSKR
jgi:hypothetical protein